MESQLKIDECGDKFSNISLAETDKRENDISFLPSAKRTGLVYDPICLKHYCIWDPNYEENPKRFTRTLERLQEEKLIEKCVEIKPRAASLSELYLNHDQDYVKKIADICTNNDPEILEKFSSKCDSVYFTPDTYNCALTSAGSAIELVDNIVQEKILNGFALIRPPGHHALKDEACGYCIFNNVAIVAKHCMKKHNLKRILIVDWDVHHGQATQRAFYEDDRVLYVSIHRYEHGAFWPELIESNFDAVGESKGKGFNINVPLNDIKLTDADYLAIWHNLLLPVFYEFNPELVLVSAGYDAAVGCPQGEMWLSPSVFGHFTHYLMGLAKGKVGVLLEGGYCLESLADSVVWTIKALVGDPLATLQLKYPIKQSVVESILSAISELQPYWDILKIQSVSKNDGKCSGDGRKHFKPIKEYRGTVEKHEKPESYLTRDCYPSQSKELKARHNRAIMIFRNRLSQSIDLSIKRTCFAALPDELSNRHHHFVDHVEKPDRIKNLRLYLQERNILDKCLIINHEKVRPVSDEQILACHSRQALENLRNAEQLNENDLRLFEKKFDSVYFTNETFRVAAKASGILLAVVDHVCSNVCLNGFAAIRPPGNLAGTDSSAGFCHLNHAAIAAYHALDNYGVGKVLILDWDIHHGNGTQNIVLDDERILYVSLHRYDFKNFYPKKFSSNYAIGKNIINIPWNGGPMSDKEYLAAFFNIVLPIAYNFEPGLVLISAGFNAAAGDPIGKYELSPYVFGHMTHLMCCLARGKVVVTLEGGCDGESSNRPAEETIRALLGLPPKPLKLPKPINGNAVETIRCVFDYQCDFWPCIAFNFDIDTDN